VRGQRTRTNARTRKGPRKQAVKLNAPLKGITNAEQKPTGRSRAGSGRGAQEAQEARKNVLDAIAHVHASFNNTIITITIARATRFPGDLGGCGFRARARAPRSRRRWRREGRRRRPGAWREERGSARRGTGTGRESAVRALNNCGLKITSIADVTPIRTTAAAAEEAQV